MILRVRNRISRNRWWVRRAPSSACSRRSIMHATTTFGTKRSVFLHMRSCFQSRFEATVASAGACRGGRRRSYGSLTTTTSTTTASSPRYDEQEIRSIVEYCATERLMRKYGNVRGVSQDCDDLKICHLVADLVNELPYHSTIRAKKHLMTFSALQTCKKKNSEKVIQKIVKGFAKPKGNNVPSVLSSTTVGDAARLAEPIVRQCIFGDQWDESDMEVRDAMEAIRRIWIADFELLVVASSKFEEEWSNPRYLGINREYTETIVGVHEAITSTLGARERVKLYNRLRKFNGLKTTRAKSKEKLWSTIETIVNTATRPLAERELLVRGMRLLMECPSTEGTDRWDLLNDLKRMTRSSTSVDVNFATLMMKARETATRGDDDADDKFNSEPISVLTRKMKTKARKGRDRLEIEPMRERLKQAIDSINRDTSRQRRLRLNENASTFEALGHKIARLRPGSEVGEEGIFHDDAAFAESSSSSSSSSSSNGVLESGGNDDYGRVTEARHNFETERMGGGEEEVVARDNKTKAENAKKIATLLLNTGRHRREKRQEPFLLRCSDPNTTYLTDTPSSIDTHYDIILDNLSSLITQEEIFSALSPCGEVVDFFPVTQQLAAESDVKKKPPKRRKRLARSKSMPGRLKEGETLGYGVVRFRSREDQQRALSDQLKYLGIYLGGHICYATSPRTRRFLSIRNLSWDLDVPTAASEISTILGTRAYHGAEPLVGYSISYGDEIEDGISKSDGGDEQEELSCRKDDDVATPSRVHELPPIVVPEHEFESRNEGKCLIEFESALDALRAFELLRRGHVMGRPLELQWEELDTKTCGPEDAVVRET